MTLDQKKQQAYTAFANSQSSIGSAMGYIKDLYSMMDKEIADLKAENAKLQHTIEHKDADIAQRDSTISLLELSLGKK